MIHDRRANLKRTFAEPGNGRSAGDRPGRAGRATAGWVRSGNVLIMVVAMLSMLFVVGSAFLATVTFESKVIEGVAAEARQEAVIDRLSTEVRSALKNSMMGYDGKPYNGELVVDKLPAGAPDGKIDTASPLGNDRYGEMPGVSPIVASIEPYQDAGGGNARFFNTTDLELFLLANANPVLAPELEPSDSLEPRNPPTEQAEFVEGNSFGLPDASKSFRRDADGDGVWDSYEFRLPESRYPESIRGGLADQLRDPDLVVDPLNPNTEAGSIFYALRVIPHGAMIDVGHAHRTLLDMTVGLVPDVNGDHRPDPPVYGPYVPESEEATLRRRFVIPPRDQAFSRLQNPCAESGEIPKALYGAFGTIGNCNNGVASDYRWWPVDTGIDGQNIYDVSNNWLAWMNPFSTNNDYDYRHLITTISHDDNLMRMGRDAGADGDWMMDIQQSEKGKTTPGDFAIDDWPFPSNAPMAMQRLNGRVKVSPAAAITVIKKDYDQFVRKQRDSRAPDLNGIDAVVGLDGGTYKQFYQQYVRLIQDGFLLMLRNVENGVFDDDPSKAEIAKSETAAALTANLIDYADSDNNPTRVEIRDFKTGEGTDKYAFGLEIQPYITEVVAAYDGVDAVFAVELFNPYQRSGTPNYDINLGSYLLRVGGNDYALSGTLAEMTYKFFSNGGSGLPAGGDNVGIEFTEGDKIQLIRKQDYGGIGGPVDHEEIVVDEADVPARFPHAGGPVDAQSIQRDSLVDHAGGWRVTLNQFSRDGDIESNDIGSLAHTLGASNGPSINLASTPVEIQFANTGHIGPGPLLDGSGTVIAEAAFPTTGSMLLLSRFANDAYDGGNGQPFTTKLIMEGDSNAVDNGRMPIFDENQEAQMPSADDPLKLSVPWGQLLFDYFTVLPQSHTYNAVDPTDMIPTVDEGGVRVHGRIDINAAPWTVLAGLPLIPVNDVPEAYRDKVECAVFLDSATGDCGTSPDPTQAQGMGSALAQSIVAYREARPITDTSTGIAVPTPDFTANRERSGTGFLTVGELANVRGSVTNPLYSIDGGNVSGADEDKDFVKAAAVLISLGDWVTTRSHVFTVYGTLRGAGRKSAVDQRAIRFQETVDRLPSVFTGKLPGRVGPRIVGSYVPSTGD